MGGVETGWYRTESGVILEMDHPLPDGIAHRVARGEITRVVGPEGGVWVPPGTPDAPPSAEQREIARLRELLAAHDIDPDSPAPQADRPPVPARNASHADWVAYAVSLGADEAVVTKLKRDDLAARFGES